MFNTKYPSWLETYQLLKEAYTPMFGTLVFTGFPERPEEVPMGDNFITCSGTGHLQYICFANAMQVRKSKRMRMQTIS